MKLHGVLFLSLTFLILSSAVTGPALAQVTVTGQAEVVNASSISTAPGANESPNIRVFAEQQCIDIPAGTLNANILASSMTPGSQQNVPLQEVPLPEGRYSSFYLFFDPSGGAPHPLKMATGHFTFDQNVAAVLASGRNSINTISPADPYFQVDADYSPGLNWGAEGDDHFTLDANDPKKLTFHLRTKSESTHNTDTVRILTACPSSIVVDDFSVLTGSGPCNTGQGAAIEGISNWHHAYDNGQGGSGGSDENGNCWVRATTGSVITITLDEPHTTGELTFVNDPSTGTVTSVTFKDTSTGAVVYSSSGFGPHIYDGANGTFDEVVADTDSNQTPAPGDRGVTIDRFEAQ